MSWPLNSAQLLTAVARAHVPYEHRLLAVAVMPASPDESVMLVEYPEGTFPASTGNGRYYLWHGRPAAMLPHDTEQYPTLEEAMIRFGEYATQCLSGL